MIQRIQSIYLLLAFASIIVSVGLQWMSWGINAAIIRQFCREEFVGCALWIIATYAFMMISAVLAVSAIFLYKNRGKQLLLSSFSQLFIVISCAFLLKDVVVGDVAGFAGYRSLIPLALAFIFVALAKRGIRRDEELVRAADRIR